MNLITPAPTLSGRYKLEAFVPGNPKRVLAEFDNLITDYGLNSLSNGYVGYRFYYCCVGTGNAPPAFTDTQLQALKAATYTSTASNGKNISAGYCFGKKTYQFAQGAAAGNLAEVGISEESNSKKLFSRALIKDAQGNPTTITVLPDEILHVTWEIRLYWPQSTVSGAIDIIGSGTHNFELLPCATNKENYWSGGKYLSIGVINIHYLYGNMPGLSPITDRPQSEPYQYINYPQTEYQPYIDGTFKQTGKLKMGISQANFPNGINGFVFSAGEFRNEYGDLSYQVFLDPPIMKTANDSLTLTVSTSWARS